MTQPSDDFDDDTRAIEFLTRAGYTFLNNGLIRAPSRDHVETPPELNALNYLFHEWDYADEPRTDWQPPSASPGPNPPHIDSATSK